MIPAMALNEELLEVVNDPRVQLLLSAGTQACGEGSPELRFA